MLCSRVMGSMFGRPYALTAPRSLTTIPKLFRAAVTMTGSSSLVPTSPKPAHLKIMPPPRCQTNSLISWSFSKMDSRLHGALS